MKKERAIQLIQENLDEVKKFHVKSLAIFGSVARDEATDESDIDILVEFDPEAKVGLFQFFDLKEYLSKILGCEVDLGTLRSLRKEIRETVLKEMIRAAWRLDAENRSWSEFICDRNLFTDLTLQMQPRCHTSLIN